MALNALLLGQIIIAFNFLYLSVFIAFYTDIRYLLYFLPFLFFLSFLLIIDIVYKKKEKITVTFNLNSKQLLLSFNLIFIILLLYITTNSLFQICSFILRLNLIQGELLYNFSYFTQYMKISLGITLTALLLLPFYGRDRTKEGEIHFERRLSKKSIFLVIIFIILIIYFFIWLQ